MLGLSGGEESSIIALRCAKMSMTRSLVVITTIKLSHTLPVCISAVSAKHTNTCWLHFFFLFYFFPVASDASSESVNNAHLPPFYFKLSLNVCLAFWGRFLSAAWYRNDKGVTIMEGKRVSRDDTWRTRRQGAVKLCDGSVGGFLLEMQSWMV